MFLVVKQSRFKNVSSLKNCRPSQSLLAFERISSRRGKEFHLLWTEPGMTGAEIFGL